MSSIQYFKDMITILPRHGRDYFYTNILGCLETNGRLYHQRHSHQHEGTFPSLTLSLGAYVSVWYPKHCYQSPRTIPPLHHWHQHSSQLSTWSWESRYSTGWQYVLEDLVAKLPRPDPFEYQHEPLRCQ